MTVLFPSSGRSFTLRGQGPDDLRDSLAASLAALERRLEEAVFLGLHRHCREHGGQVTSTAAAARPQRVARRC